ncbi:MAG: hypothetical protein AAGG72_06800, partial [Pseudomonadota bacterium]
MLPENFCGARRRAVKSVFRASWHIAIAAACALTATPTVAQNTNGNFDLESIKRTMQELKRKADAELERHKRRAAGKAEPTAESSKQGDDNGAAVTNAKQAPAEPPTRKASTKTAPAANARKEPVIRNPDGRPVDMQQAAAREREADDVMQALERARAAREAWLDDDPSSVLDALPDQPPAPRNTRNQTRPSEIDPRIVALPRYDASRQSDVSPDEKARPQAKSAGANERQAVARPRVFEPDTATAGSIEPTTTARGSDELLPFGDRTERTRDFDDDDANGWSYRASDPDVGRPQTNRAREQADDAWQPGGQNQQATSKSTRLSPTAAPRKPKSQPTRRATVLL